jgi:hypothetical protein
LNQQNEIKREHWTWDKQGEFEYMSKTRKGGLKNPKLSADKKQLLPSWRK